jgi:long-chain acyl-CoA synthetase
LFNLANLKKFGNKVFSIDENNNKFTYNNLIESIKKFNFIYKLNDQNLSILVAENCYSFIVIYFANLISKSKIILLHPNYFNSNSATIINNYKPDYIFIPNNIKKQKSILRNIEKKIYGEYSVFILYQKKKKLINKELAIMLPTSGSIGKPKFVCLSYENLKNNTREIKRYLKINTQSSVITTLSPSYSYGLSIINSHVISGSKIILNNRSLIDAKFWKLLIENKINFFYGVPLMFEILFKSSKFFDQLKTIKTFACAGGHLNKEIKLRMLKVLNDKKIFIMYGQTEASPRISYLDLSNNQDKLESIGKPLNGGKLWIENDKKELNNKNSGELIYKGRNVMLFYANSRNDLSNLRKNDYILKTNDLGYEDLEGFFYISGRKNRIAKINGVRVELDILEKDFKKYEIICVVLEKYLYLCSKKDLNNQLILKISETYNLSINNIKIKKIDHIPLNNNNKIDYSKIKEILKND